jgi:hypothetical protein
MMVRPSPTPPKFLSDKTIALFKGLENMGKGLGCDSDPTIFDFENKLLVCFVSRPNHNPFARGSKFHRIADEVPKNLVETNRIGQDIVCGSLQIQAHV